MNIEIEKQKNKKKRKKLVFYVKSDNTIDVALRLDGPHTHIFNFSSLKKFS